MRRVALLALLGIPVVFAASDGPDAGGLTWIDSDDSSGPPHVVLDIDDEGEDLGLGDEDTGLVELPFTFQFYSSSEDALYVGDNGTAFLQSTGHDAASASCPTSGSWTGIAAYWDDLVTNSVQVAHLGQYPYRMSVIEWAGIQPGTATDDGRVQLWVQEGRNDVVVVLDDIDFSDTAYDGGAGAVIGVQGSSSAGLAWSCSGGLSSGTSAWFGLATERPDSAEVDLGQSNISYYGESSYQYIGEVLASADFNDDALSDLIIGVPQGDAVYLAHGTVSPSNTSLASTSASFQGASGDELGEAVAIGDWDGDGLPDLAMGEPKGDQAASDAGSVYLFANDAWSGSITARTEYDALLTGPSAATKAYAGTALASGDIDGDGVDDLLVAAPGDDETGTNAGAVYLFSGGSISGTTDLATLGHVDGSSAGEKLGEAMAVGDADGDGVADMLLASPQNDDNGVESGRVWYLLGSSWSGSADVSTVADASFTGSATLDYLADSLLIGDFDGDGSGDLLMGTGRESTGATRAGALYLFSDGGTWSGDYDASDADLVVYGESGSQNFGETLSTVDLTGDGDLELLVGAPGNSGSDGAVYVFGVLSSATTAPSDADHTLSGWYSGGEAGIGVVGMGDHNGDGFAEVAVGTWFASVVSGTLNGMITIWDYSPSFQDEDGDGLVAQAAGGPDCDDDDATIFPGAPEDTAASGFFADDDDCDGWIDGLVQLRYDSDYWEWDLEQTFAPTAEPTAFDFESSASGDDPSALYSGDGVTFTASGSLYCSDEAFGAAANDTLAAQVSAGTTNAVLITFDSDVDGVALQLLDPSGSFFVEPFTSAGDALLPSGAGIELEASGNDVPGGRFVGLTFAEPVGYLRIEGEPTDGWGFDDLQVAWTDDSDRDGDGYSTRDGDCDETDDEVNPDGTEDISDGVDNDCDGTTDGGGADAYTDPSSWETDGGIDVQIIDFEDLTSGDAVTTQYSSVGADFDGALDVTTDIAGVSPNDSLGAEASSTTAVITFDEVQPAVGLYLFDANGSFDVNGYVAGTLVYTNTLTLTEENSKSFRGFVYDYGVDELEIVGPSGEDWGVDDVMFSELGLDDADGDGYTEADGDCDDDDADANPDAEEVWYDGTDSDCDGASDYDVDGDGYDSSDYGGEDCDESDADVNPDAEETWYDGVDSDCDEWSDYDSDYDGHDGTDYGGDDCDESDADVNPDAEEVYYDSTDDNCDGGTDDYDADGDGYSGTGYPDGSSGGGDCDEDDSSTYPGAEETWYDGVDSDCGGDSDADADGDGYDAEAEGGEDCDDGNATVNPDGIDTWYDGVDTDCDDASDYDADGDGYDHDSYGGSDCDDSDATINPLATESDNDDGIDEDCDGTDEWDDDGDGYRADDKGGSDCDDDDAGVSPGATETCYDGVDQDCDSSNEYDCDEDGYDSDAYGGTDCDDSDGASFPGATDYPYDGVDSDCAGDDDYDYDADGYQVDFYGGTDCDDEDASVSPAATEIWYDGVDQDCAGDSDFDADGDTEDAELYLGTDCDDTDSSVCLACPEVAYDGIDQDCDGADLIDADDDGHDALAEGGDDCDDEDATISPSAEETWYDGVDSDCDGASDYDADGDGQESDDYAGTDCDDDDDQAFYGNTEIYYDGRDGDCLGDDDYDQDGDGHAIDTWGGDDCNDTNADVNPSVALDDCGRGDEDCDGEIDEDCVLDTGASDDTAAPDDTGTPTDDTGVSTDDTSTPSDDTGVSTDDSSADTGPTSGGEIKTIYEGDEGCAGCSSRSGLRGRYSGALGLLGLMMLRRRRARTTGLRSPWS